MDKPNKNDNNCQERPMNTNFQEIFYQSPIGILLYDKTGKLIDANDSALNIAKIPKLDDVLGTNLFDNPKIASKKNELIKKKLIKFQDTLDLIKINEQNIYDPIELEIIDIDWIVSMVDTGFMVQIQDITQQKKIMDENESFIIDLQNERDKLSALINSIPLEVWFADKNKKFTLANPSAIREIGLYSDNIDIEELASSLEVFNPDGSPRPVNEAPPLKALKGEIVRNMEEIVRIPASKELRYREVNASPVKDIDGNIIGAISIVMDITARKHAEEALNESEEKYRNIVETANEGIMIGDTSGKIIFVNSKTEEILGYTADELIGTDGLFLIDKNELEIAHKQIKDRKNGIKEEYERKFIRKNGEQIWAIVSATPLQDNKCNHTGNLSMITDITGRKKREIELKLTMDKLKRSNQELERFAYVSSHDLQEPLRMVTLYSQLLERRYKDRLDDDADDFIEYIVENAKHMKQLIDDLLEYSKVSSLAKEFENVELEKLLDVVLNNLSISIADNNVKVTHESLPTIFADQNQMLRVFQNLITNAIKFRGVQTPEIHISAQKDQTKWTFSVSDNGIGIKPEHQKQIFEVFKRLHTREEYPGTGIGLSIVQKIIKHHDGQIWVESEPGKGSTFYFTIPFKS